MAFSIFPPIWFTSHSSLDLFPWRPSHLFTTTSPGFPDHPGCKVKAQKISMEWTHEYKTKAGALDPTSSCRKQRDFISFLESASTLNISGALQTVEKFLVTIFMETAANDIGPLRALGITVSYLQTLPGRPAETFVTFYWPGLQNQVGFFVCLFFGLTGLPRFRSPPPQWDVPDHSS